MPTLDVLDKLKSQVNQLGDEPRLLAERGETIPDVKPPESAIDPGLDALLGNEVNGGGVDEMEALLGSYAEDLDDLETPPAEVSQEAGEIEDLADLGLDDLIAGEPPGDAGEDFDIAGLDDLDFGDLEIPETAGEIGPEDLGVGEISEIEGIDDLSEDRIDSPIEDMETGASEDLSALLDGLADDGASVDLGEGAGEDQAVGLGDRDEAAVEDEAFDLDDLGDAAIDEEAFDLGDLSEAVVEDEAFDLGDLGDVTAEEEVFDLGDLSEPAEGDGAFNLADSGETAIEDETFDFDDASSEGEAFDLGDLTEPAVAGIVAGLDDSAAIDEIDEVPTPQEPTLPEDDFSIDDLDTFDLDKSPAPAEDLPEEESTESLTTTETPAEDTFDLGDLGDFEIGGESDALAGMDFAETEIIGDGDLELTDGDLTDDLEITEAEALDEIGGMEDLGAPGDEEEIPDIGAAMEGLGDLDDIGDESAGELTLDDDLDFSAELGADVLSDIKDVDDDSQQFSMDDFGDQYNFSETESGYTDDLGVDLDKLEQSLDDAAEEGEKPFRLDEEDFLALRQTLADLPRNLKIAIEEILSDERRNIEDLKPFIDLLIDGESPKVLADRFKTITKRKIELPRSYEKRSGRALEERRASLTYRLLREGWPVVRMILVIISAAWLLGAAVFMWVYRPLKADNQYRQGLEAVAVDDVERAEELFHDAWDGWPLFDSPEGGDRIADAPIIVKGWKAPNRWLDYARALRRRKHWDESQVFYEGYLAGRPADRDVRLEYSEFLSTILGKYETAIRTLEAAPLTGRVKWDRDYVLAAGDVYLDWAEDDPTKYEDARYRYAEVLERSRNDERAILSMMRYHMRLQDEDEILTLLPIFRNETPGQTDEPALAAEVFAGLGEFHLARGNSEESWRFIDLAQNADPGAPEPFFAKARYWRFIGDAQSALNAYQRTLINLDGRESLETNHLRMRILSLGGIGRINAAAALSLGSNPAQANELRGLAMNNYGKALDLYEDARSRNQLGASPEYGLLYMELGDIMYLGDGSDSDLDFTLVPRRESLGSNSDRIRELRQAEDFYNRAEELFDRGRGGSDLPVATLYRRAYARYILNDDEALIDFHRVARRRPNDYESHMALATVLLETGDYEASRSQYARSIELLDEELRRTGGELDPLIRQSHEELLIRYIAAWNNLGVGRARTAARGGGEDDYAAALSAFTMASEYLDEVFTDMGGLNSRGVIGLRDPEERRVVETIDGRNLLSEKATYPYRNRLRLLGLETADVGEDDYLVYPDIPSDLRNR